MSFRDKKSLFQEMVGVVFWLVFFAGLALLANEHRQRKCLEWGPEQMIEYCVENPSGNPTCYQKQGRACLKLEEP